MRGVLLKDLYIAKSGIILTLTSLFVLTFGLSFLLDVSAILMLAASRFYCCGLYKYYQ